MPRYLVERRFSVTEDQMPRLGKQSRIVLQAVPQVTWELSHVVIGDDDLVTTFCIYEAPSESEIQEHARRLGEHYIGFICEIAGDVTPEDFPLDEAEVP